ncbi:MAG: response regulator, partial [Candidatus Omnitrophica bacterium]|nr:response regulator [Candidatus Omnitrophota bacterium]
MKIIMIDDDLELCELTAKVLSREGYDVSFFPNARDGITTAREDAPELILMDMMMPEM